ncbi:hypothetical protein Ade02nite_17040 [Paractinoplanes deccanensis]|uniref:Uncharacterized protein n=1 Tax=Paractinoplanes deccanensis TaxID=113561 RepID=A0ABQ3XZ81_9ACTN|nr:hypothetical protein [Actinoplanes deccanensis]GID73063.1 hypothetical protein Ade02nite_17040 [Actinoplanes deccanensis]
MTTTSEVGGSRARFEDKARALVGRRLTGIGYWDIIGDGSDRDLWDFGDWHHAVMGVELGTDADPVTVTWTNTFYPYGVEVFDEPIGRHVVEDPDGARRIGPDIEASSPWHPGS